MTHPEFLDQIIRIRKKDNADAGKQKGLFGL